MHYNDSIPPFLKIAFVVSINIFQIVSIWDDTKIKKLNVKNLVESLERFRIEQNLSSKNFAEKHMFTIRTSNLIREQLKNT